MLDIRFVRENPDIVKENIKKKFQDQKLPLVDEVIRLDAEKRKVYLGEDEIHVTPMEYALLLLLFKNQGKVLTTSVILREIWGAGYGQDTQALRTLTAGLRRKIEKNPARPRYILTEIGVGYRLAEERE